MYCWTTQTDDISNVDFTLVVALFTLGITAEPHSPEHSSVTAPFPGDLSLIRAHFSHRTCPGRPVTRAQFSHRIFPKRPVTRAQFSHRIFPGRPVTRAQFSHRIFPGRSVTRAQFSHRTFPRQAVKQLTSTFTS